MACKYSKGQSHNLGHVHYCDSCKHMYLTEDPEFTNICAPCLGTCSPHHPVVQYSMCNWEDKDA